MAIKGIQLGGKGGSMFYDDQGLPVDAHGLPINVQEQAPLVLLGANGQPADCIGSREDLIKIMSSHRYKTDHQYQRAIVDLVAKSDLVDLGMQPEEPEGNPMLDSMYEEAKASHIRKVFGSKEYQEDASVRYEVARTIATSPEMANELAAGRVVEHPEGLQVVIHSEDGDNAQ